MAYLEGGHVLHVQRKAYLPTYGRFDERKHFSPGQSLAAFEAQGTRLALVICNDAWQPTVPFLAVHDGAQVLILPACSSAPADPAEAEQLERDWHDLLHFHARFLQTYVLFVNRVGSEAGLTFWGGSAVVDPWGEVVARAPRHDPALLVCDLDLSAVRRARRAMPLVKEARLGLLARELKRLTRHGGDL
jgi:predicted amidohydrolase